MRLNWGRHPCLRLNSFSCQSGAKLLLLNTRLDCLVTCSLIQVLFQLYSFEWLKLQRLSDASLAFL